ncbi:type I glyceraldehyde-3-phosphate dehydrogenase [bacterium]|nr:type I glyceraldehyde-3-phosphate dehydrogenase [bacterium]MBT3730278.1 type I glyceraldehyde-3-phosphate dehydrogenase [bacterium]MBT4894556.1 type I glyceraldehyde-3-phosphate dehydrogenase [bacterium]
MKKTKIAINGFGRIGRAFFRIAKDSPGVEVVAINDIGDIDNIAYLLKYDSVYGKLDEEVSVDGSNLKVGDRVITFLSEREPAKLPWKDLDIDIVVESTGRFADYGKANAHRDAGAKRVVVSSPVKGEAPEGIDAATVLMGVNEDRLKTCDISSNASCTTNSASPVMQIMEEALDVEKALLDTIHGYTATQALVDSPSHENEDVRRGRAAAHNIIPSSTGAATSVTKAVKGIPFFDGIAVRVPVITGSYADLTFVTKKETTQEEVNEILKKAAKEDRWKGVFTVTEEPLVSSDIIGNPHASIADLSFTRVAGGNLIKILSWYDNEAGYANSLLKHVVATAKHIT